MSEPKATEKPYMLLMELDTNDAEFLYSVSLELKKRGIVQRRGVKPAAKHLLRNSIKLLRSNNSTSSALI
jgi:hypothetical protein